VGSLADVSTPQPLTLPATDDLAAWGAFLDDRVLGGLEEARSLVAVLRETPAGDEESLLRWNDLHVVLGNAFAIAGLLSQVHPDGELRERAEGYEQQLHELRTALMLDPQVYAVLEAAPTEGLPDGADRVLEDALRAFRRAGVDRDDATRDRLRDLAARDTDLSQAFSRNIRDGAGETRVPASALEGLPEDYLEAHPADADGTVTITTGYPDTNPFLMFARDRDARHAVMHTFLNIGWPANDQVLQHLLKVRDEQARLLGYASWPDYDAEVKMIGTGDAVAAFIDQVASDAAPSSERDAAVLLERARQDHPDLERLDVADARFYGEVVRREQYDVDGQQVRAYFDSERVRAGLLEVTGRLFGLEYTPVEQAPSWHAEVATYDVVLVETGERLGRIHLDLHPRAGKYNHAAQFDLVRGVGGRQLPEGVLVCNFGAPGWTTPRSSRCSTSSATCCTTCWPAGTRGPVLRRRHRVGLRPRRPARCSRSGPGTTACSAASRSTPTGTPSPRRWSSGCGPPTSSARATTRARRCTTRPCPTASTPSSPST
jgi:thimet oligopeptidase